MCTHKGGEINSQKLSDILRGEIHRLMVCWGKIDCFFIYLLTCHQLLAQQNLPGTAICLAVVSASNCPQHYPQLWPDTNLNTLSVDARGRNRSTYIVEHGDCLCELLAQIYPFLSTTPPPSYHHRAPARELTS